MYALTIFVRGTVVLTFVVLVEILTFPAPALISTLIKHPMFTFSPITEEPILRVEAPTTPTAVSTIPSTKLNFAA
jgi:hypothetical protein